MKTTKDVVFPVFVYSEEANWFHSVLERPILATIKGIKQKKYVGNLVDSSGVIYQIIDTVIIERMKPKISDLLLFIRWCHVDYILEEVGVMDFEDYRQFFLSFIDSHRHAVTSTHDPEEMKKIVANAVSMEEIVKLFL